MNETWDKVAKLDLESVRRKLLFKKGWWWRVRTNILRLESEYRQFLYLIASNPDQTVVPWSNDLDDFWHEHILDTAKYARDCVAIMGRFIHHNPHLPEGTPAHMQAFAATRRMYQTAFEHAIAKGRRRTSGDIGCAADMPVVFCGGGASDGGHHAHGGHHGADPGGVHPGDAGGGHGHGGGGHGGGHGCGGHGCGGGGGH